MTRSNFQFPKAQLEQVFTKLLQSNSYLSSRVDSQMCNLLLDYLELMHKWNRAYNLTAIKDPEQMLIKHIFDSLAVAPYFSQYHKVLDVGTGAGLPGIPLAIFFAKENPQMHFTLLDSLGKRIQFLRHVVLTLNLKNVTIIHSPVENYQEEQFDCITSRAFTALDRMTLVCSHLLSPQGNYVLLKGAKTEEELQTLPQEFALVDIHEVKVPGIEDNERFVVTIKRAI
ncbi:16S rRNA (guanine(527)-N(7))-methyltransferase RsmG [Psittacicella gerlachiana]|uniref:Ribosomal RNA small subunit methyltransferase G n=1 Tax=Psittacicella gerlachiana TaxID=2028574 RepID=A0A3A1Y7U8_9GAMM|nr:16S rRNA (guanine(527)-N(7))-methyltransferase RsmG [Psittacicella gerlachiana]RIY33601.1 16S rRNA (guanine(527)-N(7))-methyltransferase RsmG [Psittacicella gerlachiana]